MAGLLFLIFIWAVVDWHPLLVWLLIIYFLTSEVSASSKRR